MKIGILSDTHDQLRRTEHAVGMLRTAGAEILIHCGDFTSPPLLRVCTTLPLYFVFGNNDLSICRELRQAAVDHAATCLEWGDFIQVGGCKIGVTHGHLASETRRRLAANPEFLLSGHSHRKADSRLHATRLINPGALHRAAEFSVAVLDSTTHHLEFLMINRQDSD